MYGHCWTQDSLTLCTLGIGTAFGESILNDTPRHATVVTSGYCELLRVEQKDFKILWEVRGSGGIQSRGKGREAKIGLGQRLIQGGSWGARAGDGDDPDFKRCNT